MAGPPRFLEYQGKTWRLSDLAKHLGIRAGTLAGRAAKGLPLDVRQRSLIKPRELRAGQVATQHPLYKTWQSMIVRCTRPIHESYPNYGGKGIRVCERWSNSFWAFVEDMGPKPTPKHTLDRVDSTGNYEPANCRWATHREQRANSKQARYITWQGETLTAADWADRFGVTYHQFWGRLRHYKYDMAKAVASVEKLKRAA